MKKIRLIIQSTGNGEHETVQFTEDFETPVKDFIIRGCTIDYDKIIDADLPSEFPLNYLLKRE